MYIADGEIHALSKDYGYIFKKIENLDIEFSSINEIQLDFFNKYAEYLYLFEKEKVLQIIVDNLMSSCGIFGYSSEDYKFIYKHSQMASSLSQYASFALKFKRSKNDNLENKNKCDH